MLTRSALVLACLVPVAAAADTEKAPSPRTGLDLIGFRTTKTAVKADPKAFVATGTPKLPGYLGVRFADAGLPAVEDVEPNSPAEKAGVKPGDIVRTVAGQPIGTVVEARNAVRGRFAGEVLPLALARGGKEMTVELTLAPLSKPFKASVERAVIGVQLDNAKGGGAEITGVTAGGGADKAGAKTGDIIRRLNSTAIDTSDAFREAMAVRVPGETITLQLKRDDKDLDVKVTVGGGADEQARGRGPQTTGWDDRLPSTFRKSVYRLAIVGVEYPDTKHSAKVEPKDWEDALFSAGSYTSKSATGQPVYGSMNDYYKELSYGTLKVEGKFVGWVEAGKKKAEYNLGSSVSSGDKAKYFAEVTQKVIDKFGKTSMDGFDGVFFIYAGERVNTSRGGLYWPHRSNFTFAGKRWSYFIVPELSRADRVTDISVICHEFGHMLGLPDLYARPELPGSEGVGVWCAMSNQLGNGRPQHFSAWSKEQMGWVKPTIIDPRVRQKLVLSPVEDSPAEVFKIPVRSDLSEYFLLENRQRKGWDKDLPADGLLIWRVVGNRPILEESHGVEGPTGPRVYSGAVPFPSPANASFTPFTTPSSKSQLGGGLDVHVTNIRRLPDGRVTFHIGYEYQ